MDEALIRAFLVLLLSLPCVAQVGQIPIVNTLPSGTSFAYAHVHSITIDHTQVGGTNSTNFPAYFGGTYSWLATVANGGQINHTTTCCANTETVPADLIFTSDSGCLTLLNWDIPTWNATTGVIEAWINIPTISSTVDTVIYACTGGSPTTYQATYTSTYNSNYKGVWHFGDGTTLDLHDSTINANTCTNNNGVTATTPLLPTGGAASFASGSSQYLSCGTSSSLLFTGPVELEAVFNEPVLPSSSEVPFMMGNTGVSRTNGFELLQQPNSGGCGQCLFGQMLNGGASAATNLTTFTPRPGAGTTNTIISRYSQGTTNAYDLFLNLGEGSGGVGASALGLSTSAFEIGGSQASIGFTFYWNGILDEVRVLNIAESNDWITAQFNNMTSTTTFYSIVSIR